ncbi:MULTISPECIES: VOC family protein [Sinorhizobium]|uniref:VOC family protein n=1 Tax=Sinorhizobium TaxID=28105 RepID=UPI000BEA05A9|nr:MULTISPECIES: VOC family protein [Sinorhizobium]PDT50878.1 glyoxalase [Sinorhizobium sp. NG07B]POH25002.1 glyoxalase [Sinorhizobium americanum]
MTAAASTTSATEALPRHQRILQEAGPAVGRISGINHLVLFTNDMNEGVRFYRDLLGLRVVRTQRFVTTGEGLRSSAHHSSGSALDAADEASSIAVEIEVRQVFFEMGNGELFSLYEAPTVANHPDAPVSSVLWPSADKDRWSQPVQPQKMDHLSFDVRSHADVVWFREHLLSHGVTVSEVSERRGINNSHRFISSIYFSDPSGNPLEISSFDSADVAWQSYDFSDWFIDEEPVAALLDGTGSKPQALVPHWVGASND